MAGVLDHGCHQQRPAVFSPDLEPADDSDGPGGDPERDDAALHRDRRAFSHHGREDHRQQIGRCPDRLRWRCDHDRARGAGRLERGSAGAPRGHRRDGVLRLRQRLWPRLQAARCFADAGRHRTTDCRDACHASVCPCCRSALAVADARRHDVAVDPGLCRAIDIARLRHLFPAAGDHGCDQSRAGDFADPGVGDSVGRARAGRTSRCARVRGHGADRSRSGGD